MFVVCIAAKYVIPPSVYADWERAIQQARNGETELEPETSGGESDGHVKTTPKLQSIEDLDNLSSSPELLDFSDLVAKTVRPRPRPAYKGAARKPFRNPYILNDDSDDDPHSTNPLVIDSPLLTPPLNISADPESPTVQATSHCLSKGKSKGTQKRRSRRISSRVTSTSDWSDSEVEINVDNQEDVGDKGKHHQAISMKAAQNSGMSQSNFVY